jgi:TRAP-type uncharacterized transport system substrate-binding protein
MMFIARLAAILLLFFALADRATAQFRRSVDILRSQSPAEASVRDRVNAGTIGLAGGLLEGAPIRFATEIARAANDASDMHVLPIVTRGPTENVNDLLYLRGVDAAIINSDALEEYKSQVPQIQQRIACILNLFPSELHVFVRPEIQTLADLAGKKVNFNTQGTAAAYSGPLIFSRLGISVDKMFIPHPTALEQLKRGEIAAVVFVTTKPVDAFAKGKWEPGFKFLPVEFGPKFADYYLASSLESADYPNLIAKDTRIATISVPTILATFNFRPDSPRYRRVARFVDELFGHMDRLRSPGFDAKWKDVDLSAAAPGLERFRAAQDWLDRTASTKQSGRP